jgi:predicted  nucleic acid-binding Zn-ribbon protein
MKSQVSDIEVQIRALSNKTFELTNNIQQVDSSLSDKKKRIQKLTNAQNAIKKLNYIFDLPKKIQSNLQNDQVAKAIVYSSKARHLLSQYTHLSAFQKIEKECELISHNIGNIVQNKLDNAVLFY